MDINKTTTIENAQKLQNRFISKEERNNLYRKAIEICEDTYLGFGMEMLKKMVDN